MKKILTTTFIILIMINSHAFANYDFEKVERDVQEQVNQEKMQNMQNNMNELQNQLDDHIRDEG